jgi:hypothetical protein
MDEAIVPPLKYYLAMFSSRTVIDSRLNSPIVPLEEFREEFV